MRVWKLIYRPTGNTVLIENEKSLQNLKTVFGETWNAFWDVSILEEEVDAKDLTIVGSLSQSGNSLGCERRKSQRFDLSFKVILVSNGKCVRSSTKNISMSGIMLPGGIPGEMMSQYVWLFVNSPDFGSKIQFACRVVDLHDGNRRLEFVNTTREQIKQLGGWIDQLSRTPVKSHPRNAA